MTRRFPLLLLLFLPSSFSFLQSLLCPCNRSQCQQSSLPLCQSHCASSCGGGGGQPVYPTQPSYGGGYGSAFGASYMPSAYQPPTVYRPQPPPQPQPLYANYALPRPLPPPQAPPPLDSQPQINVQPASAPSAAAYVSHHPTLLQPAPGYPTSLPSHPPDFDSSASLIQYSTLKRGEGRSLRGALRPRTTPLSPDGEEPFETFERNHMKREETDEELQQAVSPSDREEELYDDAVTAPPRDNEIAFHAPREKEEGQDGDGPSAAEGDDEETLARILKEEQESAQGSQLGRGFKFITWAAQGNRKKKDNQEEEKLGPPLKHKCNNPELRRIMEEKMVGSPSASKQLVYSAVRAAFGRSPDVICSRSSFSYIVVSSPVYCEHKKAPSTCFVYFQP